MRIGGLQKFSLIDYPGKVAAVVFTQGCNFRCSYCQNPELVLPWMFEDPIPVKTVLQFLEKRSGQLEGVVVTGGEPTLQKDLFSFLERIKAMGYCVKLDTNGSHPEVLKKLIAFGLVDFIAMDIKAPLEKYCEVTCVLTNTQRLKESIDVILKSGLAYEFRTTLVKSLFPAEDLSKIASLVPDAKRYVVQRFVPSYKMLDRDLLHSRQYTVEEMNEIKTQWDRGVVVR